MIHSAFVLCQQTWRLKLHDELIIIPSSRLKGVKKETHPLFYSTIPRPGNPIWQYPPKKWRYLFPLDFVGLKYRELKGAYNWKTYYQS